MAGLAARATVDCMRQDPTFKDIFAYPFMVEELLRWFVAGIPGGRELVDGLDFSRLLRVQEQSTAGPSEGKRSYANDLVWRLPFRERGDDHGNRAWLHLVLMIEVQGEVDHLMALRVRNYVDNHHMELWRGKRFGARDRLAPMLPIVIYTGTSSWTAATRVIDLVTPGVGAVADLDLAVRASGVFAGDGYLTLDTRRVATDDLRRDNAAAMLAGLCNPSLDRIPADAAALRARLDAPEPRPLLEVVLLWAQQTARRLIDFDLEVDDMAEVDRLPSRASWRTTSRRVERPTRIGTAPRVWRAAWSRASSEDLPKSGICCAGKRTASSTPTRQSGLRASWPTSATPKVGRGQAT